MIYSRIKNKLEGSWNGHQPINKVGGKRSLGMIVAKQMFGITKQIKGYQIKALVKKGAERISKETQILIL